MHRRRTPTCRKLGRVALGLGLLTGAALAPVSARAWTEATVRSAQASVAVEDDGTALVALQLEVRVNRGWLEGLELAGLDPDLRLDETKPVWATSLDAPHKKFEPQVRVNRDGTLYISFPGRGGSPRRGRHLVGLVYRARLGIGRQDVDNSPRGGRLIPDGGENVLVEWSLPPWESGLDQVGVALEVPGRAAFHAPAGPTAEHETGRRVAGQATTTLLWERAHLPRTTTWTVAAVVPATSFGEGVRGRLVAKSGGFPKPIPRSHSLEPIAAAAGSLWLWLLLCGTWFRREARRRQAEPRPVLPLPTAVRHAVVAGLVIAAVLHWNTSARESFWLLAAATFLSLFVTSSRNRAFPEAGEWRSVRRADWGRVLRARGRDRLGLALPHDATSALGIVLGASWTAIIAGLSTHQDPHLLGTVVLFWAPALTATRWHLPSRTTERLDRLRRLANLDERTLASSDRGA